MIFYVLISFSVCLRNGFIFYLQVTTKVKFFDKTGNLVDFQGILIFDTYHSPISREYDVLVKIDGCWYIKKRYITTDGGLPASWEGNFKPRKFR